MKINKSPIQTGIHLLIHCHVAHRLSHVLDSPTCSCLRLSLSGLAVHLQPSCFAEETLHATETLHCMHTNCAARRNPACSPFLDTVSLCAVSTHSLR